VKNSLILLRGQRSGGMALWQADCRGVEVDRFKTLVADLAKETGFAFREKGNYSFKTTT
jgi:hypothetical protein